MSIGPDFDVKERVRQATDIVDLLGRSMHLRRQGRNLVGLCPFHDDRRPSLQVNEERQTWKCWVCNVGGDVFSFVMQREGVDFREALEMLAERANIELRPRGPQAAASGSAAVSEKQLLYRAMQWAADQYHRYLQSDPAAATARDYLLEREIELPTTDRFHLGYAPDQWSWLLDRARSTPHRPEILEACGLVEKKAETGSYYDRFRGRLLFPIRDTQQRVVALGGRVLPESEAAFTEKFGRKPAKYINSPETKIYTKSDHLYGLDISRDAVAKSRQIVIVEGYTDVVLTWQAGISNIAAVLGTALNERHLRLIKRFADQVVLVLDGDAAGQKRTNEVLDLFVAADLDLRVLTLPEGLDPADFVQQRGVGEFQQQLDQAGDALDHKIALETQGLDVVNETHRVSQALDSILRTIAQAPRLEIRNLSANRLREQAIITKLARRFLMEEGPIRIRLDELRQERKRARPFAAEPTPAQPQQSIDQILTQAVAHELQVLEILIAVPEKIDPIIENIPPDQFVVGPLRELYEAFCHLYHTGEEVDFQRILTMLEDPQQKSLLVALDERVQSKLSVGLGDCDRWVQDIIGTFQRLLEAHEQRQLISQLDQRDLSEKEEQDVLARIFAQKLAEQTRRAE